MQVVLSSCPAQDADSLATGLVEQRLAACVKLLGPVSSVYAWDGQIHKDREVVLLIKTRAACWNALQKWMSENHPYDVPELIALPVESAAADYLNWISLQTT